MVWPFISAEVLAVAAPATAISEPAATITSRPYERQL